MKKYSRKASKVEAVQYNGKNTEAIKKWAGEKIITIESEKCVYMVIKKSGYHSVLPVKDNDYIVKEPDLNTRSYSYMLCGPEDFNKLFEERNDS